MVMLMLIPNPCALSMFLLSHLLLLPHLAGQQPASNQGDKQCPDKITCGIHGQLKFPLTNSTYPGCGLCAVDCSSNKNRPRIQILPTGLFLEAQGDLNKDDSIAINDSSLSTFLSNKDCGFVDRFIGFKRPTQLPSSRSGLVFSIQPNMTVFKCSKINNEQRVDRDNEYFRNYTSYDCENHTLYYNYWATEAEAPAKLHPTCRPSIYVPVVSKPRLEGGNMSDLFSFLAYQFNLQLHVSERCKNCYDPKGPSCLLDGQCNASKQGDARNKIILATVIPGSFLIVVAVGIFLFWKRKKIKLFSYLPSLKNSSSNPSSKRDFEGNIEYFGASVFTYEELVEATKSFDPSKELGDGGFGTVYHGRLSDGREVAVKRLYEHNYKRVMQFMNEVQILTRLRHRNLVNLYGCTSRHSRELLLVYEYVSNGTVADHLHGDLAHKRLLTWPVRMNIAIETAAALAYLHHSDIIHRDVKTTNILLDANFVVKVADFGLSKSLPENATHVSTAPQGTPGYVDPEYYQCYQITEKSDVYSFGVVLVELISSMPAVDIGRHRQEINLSNLAINRIQNCALDDLIDSELGYKWDSSVRRMTTSVAELAFGCLQNEKDFRPTMDEVVASLIEIRDYIDGDITNQRVVEMRMPPPPSPEGDHIILLKNYTPGMSPNTVTAKWVSGSSTINST